MTHPDIVHSEIVVDTLCVMYTASVRYSSFPGRRARSLADLSLSHIFTKNRQSGERRTTTFGTSPSTAWEIGLDHGSLVGNYSCFATIRRFERRSVECRACQSCADCPGMDDSAPVR
jgi:hypothetical protein